MGKFVDVCIDGIEEYFTSKGYSAMLTLVNKNDSHVLYKVRLSSHAKKNVMVKSNTGLLLSNNNTTITLDIHKDKKPFNVQIVTTPFHEENCITNFSRALSDGGASGAMAPPPYIILRGDRGDRPPSGDWCWGLVPPMAKKNCPPSES